MHNDDLLVEDTEFENLHILIKYDDTSGDFETPRDWGNLGTMYCWHRNYELGDKHPYKNCTPDEMLEIIKEDEGDTFMLPVYLYDHSGLRMSTGSFNDRWDSGQVGFIYVSKKKVREEYSCKRITKKLEEKVYKILEAEVETYDQYLSGQVYGFVVEDENENVLDSCWGFYGLDYCKEEGLSSAKSIYENSIGYGGGI